MEAHTIEQRSRNLAAIKGRNTRPEMCVRSVLPTPGYRFRLHNKELPGKPDIVLPEYRTVIFVHGCLWHLTIVMRDAVPKTGSEFRTSKRGRWSAIKSSEALRTSGWKVLVIRERLRRSEDGPREWLISELGRRSPIPRQCHSPTDSRRRDSPPRNPPAPAADRRKPTQSLHPEKVVVTLSHGSPALLSFDGKEQTH
jgi:DNA mismatch endonuclease, patch repair protein